MKKLFTIVMLITALWVLKFAFPRLRIEGYSGMIFRMISKDENTKYPPGYSDEKFLKIKIGMTEREVINVLGEPLTRWKPAPDEGLSALSYSESPTYSDYSLRQVYIRKGKVIEIAGYFYLD